MAERNHTRVSEFILLGFTDHRELQLPLFMLFLAVYIITLLGNLGMITLIKTDAQLHTPMYFFLSYLSFVDICYSSNVTPRMLANFVGYKGISFCGCLIQCYLFIALVLTESFILAAMAYDSGSQGPAEGGRTARAGLSGGSPSDLPGLGLLELLRDTTAAAEREAEAARRVWRGRPPEEGLVLLFPGQGSQFVGMGAGLLHYPEARELFQLRGPEAKLGHTARRQLAIFITSLAVLDVLHCRRPTELRLPIHWSLVPNPVIAVNISE
ncbi:hypothetical protein lerEdw1_011278 [Lerista edwardsae]|nr:hypothetical protein lerEdw1_011278 [Lerista edwardsae]